MHLLFLQPRLMRQSVLLAMGLCVIAAMTSAAPAQATGDTPSDDDPEPDGGVVNYLVLEERAQPFQIVKAGVSDGGIVTDIVSAIFSGSRWAIKPIVMPINRLKQAVLNGDVSHWIAYDALRWRAFANKGLMVDESLFNTRHALLTCRRDLPDRVTSMGQLQGLRFATIRGFSYPEIEQAASAGLLQQIAVDRYDAGITLVTMGRVDAFLEMKRRLQYHMKTAKNAGCVRWIDLSDVVPEFSIYLSVSAEWPRDFRSFIADRIRHLKATGRLAAILARYTQPPAKPADRFNDAATSPK